jgi:hypothetical protein
MCGWIMPSTSEEGFSSEGPSEEGPSAEEGSPEEEGKEGHNPPIRDDCSKTVTWNVPGGKWWRRVLAVVKPAGPAPMMQILLGLVGMGWD